MSTPAQIAANQANSKLSTGATSEAGKKIVSQNSLKYGLCSKVHIALPGERNALEEHVEGYLRPMPRSAYPSGILSAISPRIIQTAARPRVGARPRDPNHLGPIGQR